MQGKLLIPIFFYFPTERGKLGSHTLWSCKNYVPKRDHYVLWFPSRFYWAGQASFEFYVSAGIKYFYLANMKYNVSLSCKLSSDFHFLPLFLALAWNMILLSTACSKATTRGITTK